MKFAKPTQLATLCAMLLLATLTACAPLTPIPEIDGHASFCQVAKIIRFSRLNDTPETIEQIKEHNAVFAKLCPVVPLTFN